MTNLISVIIVDDHDAVRNGIRAYLETLPIFEVVGEAVSGEEALTLVSELIPDIVLLDLITSGMECIETVSRVKQISPRTKVIVLTSYHENALIFPVLKAGASSYILKEMKMEKLADELHRVIQGEVIIHPSVATHILQNILCEEDSQQFLFIELTDYELDILKLIANGLTNGQVAEKLVVSENIVKGHVSNILSKLHFTGVVQKVLKSR
jgi:DNA-binding NarL/FixJ family response regulator